MILAFSCLFYTELDLYQSKGKIPKDVVLLAIGDPKAEIGSGGATLNALLIVTEHLSARAGYTVNLFKSHNIVKPALLYSTLFVSEEYL